MHEEAAIEQQLGRSVTISRQLAEQDPSNAGWQRDLAVACNRSARIAIAAGRNDIGLSLYEESLGIFATLVERAPGFAAWAEEMNVVKAELAALRASVPLERCD
jgi:hypothetical protein